MQKNTFEYVNKVLDKILCMFKKLKAENGITLDGLTFKLGGKLTEDTTINLNEKTFTINGEGDAKENISIANSTKSLLFEKGKNVLDLKEKLGVPNGLDGAALYYLEDESDFLNSNGAKVLLGDFTDIAGFSSGLSMGVGNFEGDIADVTFAAINNESTGFAHANIETLGFGTGVSSVNIAADHNDDSNLASIEFRIGNTNVNKILGVNNQFVSIKDNINNAGYNLPWTSPSFGQVLMKGSSATLEWTDLNSVLPRYADDAAADVGGLTTNQRYQTDGTGAAPLNVAGIQMIKQ